MKDSIEHLLRFDASLLNRDQVMGLKPQFKIHTNVSNVIVSIYRLVKILNSPQFPIQLRDCQL